MEKRTGPGKFRRGGSLQERKAESGREKVVGWEAGKVPKIF